jgi:drug/metabolite transporter superfamily protein YnfA
MSLLFSLFVLLMAAVLEASGDALMRTGMHASTPKKLGWFMAAAIILLGYGYLVNSPPWDFGKLLGVYVVFFFLIAQAVSWITSGTRPSGAIIIGGAFIVVGGAIISYSTIPN